MGTRSKSRLDLTVAPILREPGTYTLHCSLQLDTLKREVSESAHYEYGRFINGNYGEEELSPSEQENMSGIEVDIFATENRLELSETIRDILGSLTENNKLNVSYSWFYKTNTVKVTIDNFPANGRKEIDNWLADINRILNQLIK